MLTDFTIQNFRGIKELTLPKLSRVNLFVGKNGVGKTSVLEALELWASRFSPDVIWRQLERRTESHLSWTDSPIEAIFGGEAKPIPAEVNSELAGTSGSAIALSSGSELNAAIVFSNRHLRIFGLYGEEQFDLLSGDWQKQRTRSSVKSAFIESKGLDSVELDRLWSALYRVRIDRPAIQMLQTMFPAVEDINVVDLGRRVPVVGLKGKPKRQPLSQLGEGAIRLLGLTVAVATAQGGVLLIDEFENGLHYSIQAEVLRFLLGLAKEFDVQVFATTHSRDAVYALHEASQGEHKNDVMVYRIQERRGKLHAVSFNPDELKFAVEEEMEVR